MAGTSVYDAIVRFVGDLSDVDKSLAGIQTTAGNAGTASGQSFGGKFGAVIKTSIGALAGAGIGVLLKAVTDGAIELDAATRKYQADTGATMEQTKLAGEQINALFRSNTDGYAVIGAVLSKLATDLHITGVEAQAAAQEFLNYAHATGQEPVAATDALTTAIKAWQIPAEQIPGLMDEIVKGHQLYGGSVNDNVAALARLAPALIAANLGVNDATGLLNLFSAAGLDSSKASVAFQVALTKVHSPEQLTAMITQIQNTPDDFDRAKLAVALFGARAGVQLADALKPGTKSLADYTVTAGDSVGATQAAADAIDQGFGNQVVMAFHNVEGSLSGLATNVGPVVDVLDALGNMGINVLPALGASLGALGPKLIPILRGMLPVFAAAGTAEGVAMGEAAVAGEGSTIVAGQPLVAAEVTPAAVTAGTGMGAALGGAVGAAAALAIPLLILGAVAAAASASESLVHDWGIATHDAIFGQHGPFDAFGGWLDSLSWPFGPKDTPVVDIGPITNIFGAKTIPDAAAAGGGAAGAAFGDALVFMTEPSLARMQTVVGMAFASIKADAVDAATRTTAILQSIAGAFAAAALRDAKTASDAIAGIFGAQDRAAALSATNAQIADDRKTISSKKSSASQIADAKLRLAADLQTQEQEEIEMALHGEIVGKKYTDLITLLNKQAKSSNAETAASAKAALSALRLEQLQADATAAALARAKLAGPEGGWSTKGKAAGGYLAAGDVSWVGETGPELRVFARDSYILDHQDAMNIAAGTFAGGGPQGGSSSSGSSAPLVGVQHVYGIQPDDLERQMLRVQRRGRLESQLAGGRA